MKKIISGLISSTVITFAAFGSLSVSVYATDNENYVYGDGHYETIEELNESVNSNMNNSENESKNIESFDKLIDMSDEEIMNISEDYKSALQSVLESPVFYEQCRYELHFTNASKYLDSNNSVIKETLADDLGIPAELIKSISGPDKSNINGKNYTTIRIGIQLESYKNHSIYDTIKTIELMLRTNKSVSVFNVERSGKAYDEDFFSGDTIRGDINSDGVINLTDLSFLSLYLLGDIEFTDKQLKTADVNGDGDVHLTDLATLMQYISHVTDSL
ncbi:MAG: dockerin type I repeat-containing protein [Oscillospiraceae bacterium]|nr:dockerin type I repeat-containing protein [Oscillospiraceae bacterium]